MKALKNKLNSRSGASIIFALLFFLVAAMVSIVILDASVTTAKRLSDDTVWEQDNLTLTSAGKLLKGCFADTTCTVTTVTEIASESTECTVTAQGPLAEILSVAVRKANDRSDAFSGTFTVSVDEESSVFKNVTVKYTIMPDQEELEGIDNENHRKDSYKFSAELTLEGSDQKMFLTAYRSIKQSAPATSDGEYLTKTDFIEWTSVTLSTKEDSE